MYSILAFTEKLDFHTKTTFSPNDVLGYQLGNIKNSRKKMKCICVGQTFVEMFMFLTFLKYCSFRRTENMVGLNELILNGV